MFDVSTHGVHGKETTSAIVASQSLLSELFEQSFDLRVPKIKDLSLTAPW